MSGQINDIRRSHDLDLQISHQRVCEREAPRENRVVSSQGAEVVARSTHENTCHQTVDTDSMLIESYGLSPHLYADYTQVYGSCPPATADSLSLRVSECAGAVSTWMKCNRLQLNLDKTEVLLCARGRRQHQLPTSAVLIAGVPITPALFVRDLGIYIDADLSMRIHVQRTVPRCFAALHQLRQIRQYVPATTFQMMVVSLVHSRLDYGNSVLVGIPAYLLRRFQSVLNAAAWLIFHLKRSDHITDALVSLHWLRVQGIVCAHAGLPSSSR